MSIRSKHHNLVLVYDDRERVTLDVQRLVGERRFGDIIIKRSTLQAHFCSSIPNSVEAKLVLLRSDDDVVVFRELLERCGENCSLCIIAGRTGFTDFDQLSRFIERLPYASESFTSSLYRPLVTFLSNAHDLVAEWDKFAKLPIHVWDKPWHGYQRLESLELQDLSDIRDFVHYISGSTATRHFNQVEIDTYYYTKRSSDKSKMLAEYSFYSLVPEKMKPWLIQTFDFIDEGERASYKMLRYYLADASIQWIHNAFDKETFSPFIKRLLFFVSERTQKKCSLEDSRKVANDLFIAKVKTRIDALLSMEAGAKLNNILKATSQDMCLEQQFMRYKRLFHRYERDFIFDYNVISHGDPCFSNILYDQVQYQLKLIDPKGAKKEDDLWSHPLYDLCKISHSILGDYDFINNGLYNVEFSETNELNLKLKNNANTDLKPIFINEIKTLGIDYKIMRLAEASLFLSMLPLHIDYPNKVLAFIIKANEILNEVESK